jgi:orotidine-5'-phosphate decarboxylase
MKMRDAERGMGVAMSVVCEPLIMAVDVGDVEAARGLVRQVAGVAGAVKIGLELFNAVGPEVFRVAREAGAERIFYDAKLCDIPNTVAGAARAAARHNLWLLNVHALCGLASMRAAREGAGEGAAAAGCAPPKIVAVTLLTSLEDRTVREELGLAGSAAEESLRLAVLAREAGLDGVVCSPWEAAAVRRECGPGFLIVTPGIRPAAVDVGGALASSPSPTHVARDDQRRIMTPGEAIRAGADYLVIGRAITAAADLGLALRMVAVEIESARGEGR